MTIQLDAASHGFISGAESLTIPHTVGAGADRLLLVSAACVNTSDFLAASTVTYGGVSLGAPIITPAIPGSNNSVYVWKMVNPPSGTANVVITPSGGAYIKAECSSWTGVDQTTPIATTYKAMTAYGEGTYTNAVVTPAGGLAVDFFSLRGVSTINPDASQTRVGTQVTGTFASVSSSYKSAATSMSWSGFAGNNLALAWAAVALTASSGGGGGGTSGTVASLPLKTNNGTLLANTLLSYVAVYDATTGVLVLRKTAVTTDVSGIFTITDAALVAGASYMFDWKTAAGQAKMPTATAV